MTSPPKTVDEVTTNYLYDADRIIEERDGSSQLLASYVYGEGIDEILTMAKGAQTYYYFYDGLGSVTDITNTNGEVIESYQYDVYGQPNHLSAIGNRYHFTGREYDGETGLYCYRARYYSPAIGRFLQKDPLTWTPSDARISYQDNVVSNFVRDFLKTKGIFDTQLLHTYNYVANNPVNWVDPMGYGKVRPKLIPLLFGVTAFTWATPWPGDEVVMTAALFTVATVVGIETAINFYKEHIKGKGKRTWDKHTNRRPGSYEKGDERRKWEHWGKGKRR